MRQKLTAQQVRGARYDGKRFKLNDGGGLYLHVIATGPVWRYDYQHHGKRKTLTIGRLQFVSLAQARIVHQSAVRLLKQEGLDPAEQKQLERQAKIAETQNTWGYRCRESARAPIVGMSSGRQVLW